MHYVIGSGPAGVACSAALLARGDEVTMLDAGLTLEPDTQAALDLMSRARSAAIGMRPCWPAGGAWRPLAVLRAS